MRRAETHHAKIDEFHPRDAFTPPSHAAWSRLALPDAPSARWGHSLTQLGENLLVVGGELTDLSPSARSDQIWSLQLGSGWRRLAAGSKTPPARRQHAAARYGGGDVAVTGGRGLKGATPASGRCGRRPRLPPRSTWAWRSLRASWRWTAGCSSSAAASRTASSTTSSRRQAAAAAATRPRAPSSRATPGSRSTCGCSCGAARAAARRGSPGVA